MNILVLSSNYPANDLPKETTPVVHYFVREWQKRNEKIIVIHNQTVFPKPIYKILKIFKRRLASKVGYMFATSYPKEICYSLDNVTVYRRNIFKLFPHCPFFNFAYKKQLHKIDQIIHENNFTPDVIVAHWITPQLFLLYKLKQKYPKAKVTLAIHEELPVLERDYGKRGLLYLNSVDKLSFRSLRIKDVFLQKYHTSLPIFMCYSGVPKHYLVNTHSKCIPTVMLKFTFVGTLINRKYPEAIIHALNNYDNRNYTINYVGEGELDGYLKQLAEKYDMSDHINFLGRLPREQVMEILKDTDCFVMISKFETFGLVYLEAMANGCITIASRDEGIDGIIKDGVNGFLCEAGNWLELRKIINHINMLSDVEKQLISMNARKTAYKMTDSNVANTYYHFINQ